MLSIGCERERKNEEEEEEEEEKKKKKKKKMEKWHFYKFLYVTIAMYFTTFDHSCIWICV